MGYKVEGTERLIAKLNAIPSRVERNTRAELSDIGDDINAKSSQAAPLDEGALRGSTYKRINDGPGGPELDVGFEGLPYIIPMHERGWLNFMGRYGPKRIEKYHGGGGENHPPAGPCAAPPPCPRPGPRR